MRWVAGCLVGSPAVTESAGRIADDGTAASSDERPIQAEGSYRPVIDHGAPACHDRQRTEPAPTGLEAMPAYVISHLQETTPHLDIAEYIERIITTLEPYGGRFLVHAKEHEVKEGSWPGRVVLIGFPGMAEARAWWESPAYQEIVPLRSRHSQTNIILVEGVPEDYDPTVAAKAIREALASE